jgi:hypothetical protein
MYACGMIELHVQGYNGCVPTGKGSGKYDWERRKGRRMTEC